MEMKQHYGTHIHVAVGGYNRAKDFAEMAVDAKRRAKFVKSLSEFVLANHFDGVDYDGPP